LTSAFSERDLLQRLPERGPVKDFDVVLIDYNLSGDSALEILKEICLARRLDIPVVIITGHGNEDIATQTLKLGAADYLVKNAGYLYQLPSMIEHAFSRSQLAREQAALRESENRFRRLAENAPDIIFRLSYKPAHHFEYVSPAVFAVTGYAPEEFYADPELALKIIVPEDRHMLNRINTDAHGRKEPLTLRWRHKDGRIIWIEERSVFVLDEAGEPLSLEGINRDVTQQMEAQAALQRQFARLDALRSIDLAISNSFDLRLVLIIFIEHVMRELNVDAVVILLYNPVNQTLEYGSGAGFRSTWLQRMVLHAGEGYAGRAILERRPFSATDLTSSSQNKDWPRFVAEEGFVAGMSAPLITKGEVKGVLQVFYRSAPSLDEDWNNFFDMLTGQISLAIYNADLFETLQRSNQELSLAYDATLEGWVRALDLRDREMEGHTQRVAQLTVSLAQALRISDEEIVHLRRGALLHDIGKMAIPDSILLKAGPLSEAEWEVMRQHPKYAMDLLAHIPYLEKALDIPFCHHEKWDGSGYPRRLRGQQIPFAARMFAVIDVFDSLCTPRLYRPSWPEERAVQYIREQSGIQFDPEVVQAFIKMLAH
jgi:PAS domain S-box-containing protein